MAPTKKPPAVKPSPMTPEQEQELKELVDPVLDQREEGERQRVAKIVRQRERLSGQRVH